MNSCISSAGYSKNNIAEYISPENPIYNEIFSQYSAIESAVKRHTMLPSFFSSTADAGAYELKWDGQQYSLTLTDTNGVLGDYTFTSNITGLNFSVSCFLQSRYFLYAVCTFSFAGKISSFP